MLRKILFQLHWLLGIIAGVILAIVGFTGGLLSFQDEILDAINADIVHVQPDGPLLTPAFLMQQIQKDHPDKRIQSFTISSDPSDAARVMFAPQRPQNAGFGNGGFGARPPEQQNVQAGVSDAARPQQQGQQNVGGDNARPQQQGPQGGAQRPGGFGGRGEMRYVNPYTGELLPPAKGREFFQTVENLHRRLLAGDVGKQITGVCTICLLILVCSGLYLRWPRDIKSWRNWLAFSFAKKGRPFLWGMHSTVGTYVLVFYALSGFTGMIMSYDWLRDGLYDLAGVPRPQGFGPPPGAPTGQPPRGDNNGQNAGSPNMQGMAMNDNPAMTRDGAPRENDDPASGERPRRREGADDNAGFARGGNGNFARGDNDFARGERRGEDGARQREGGGKPAFDASAAWDAFEQAVPDYSTATLRTPTPGQPVQFTYMDAVPQNKRAFNRLTLDPNTLAVKQNDRYADKSLAGKLLASVFPLHSGNFFGWPITVLIMVASLLMPLFAITGWMMYLQRRKFI